MAFWHSAAETYSTKICNDKNQSDGGANAALVNDCLSLEDSWSHPPSRSRAPPRRPRAGGSRWSARCRTCSTPRGCPPGSPRNPRRPPAPRASPCWGGTAPRWAFPSSAAAAARAPAASPGSRWWPSAGGRRREDAQEEDSHEALLLLSIHLLILFWFVPLINSHVKLKKNVFFNFYSLIHNWKCHSHGSFKNLFFPTPATQFKCSYPQGL